MDGHGHRWDDTQNDVSALTTALIYTRVSTDEQAREGISLAAQLADARRYAAQRGWVIGGEYQDVLSGTRDDRPQYQAMLTEIRQLRMSGCRVVVVVAALDRFGRRLLERVRAREELKGLGVPTHSIREGGEVSDLVANILASVAQEEVRRLGERISAVRQHTATNGWFFPGPAPWGYRWRESTSEERAQGATKNVLDIDPEIVPYVQEAFRQVAQGKSVRSAARWAQSLPTAMLAGRNMSLKAMLRILTNPVYISRQRTGASDVFNRPVGRWPALVNDATWQRVQQCIAGHTHMPHQASGHYLLTGLLRCPQCGSRMAGNKLHLRLHRYRCNGEALGVRAPDLQCNWTAIMPPIDAAVLNEVAELVDVVASTDPGLQASLRRAWRILAQPAGAEETMQRIRHLEREAEKSRQRLKNAAKLLVDGILDKTGYELLRDEASRDLQATADELARINGHKAVPILPDLDTALCEAGGWSRALREADVPAQRDVLAILIDRVVPVRLRRGEYHVKITWTPLGEGLKALVVAAGSTIAA